MFGDQGRTQCARSRVSAHHVPDDQLIARGREAFLDDAGRFQTDFPHLACVRDACGFLRNKPKRPGMVRKIRSLFLRAGLMEQEVQTLHGIVAELSKGRGAPADDADGNQAGGEPPGPPAAGGGWPLRAIMIYRRRS